MKKMLIIMGIVFIIIFGWYGGKKILFAKFAGSYTPPPVTVSAAPAQSLYWDQNINTVGTITAVNGVEISAETAGIVKAIRFNSGQFVKKDDILVLLDIDEEQAVLKDSLAQLKLAQLNYNRDKILLNKNVISQVMLDTDLAKLHQTEASVDQAKAKIKQKTITAPFAGKVGIRQINLGQYIAAGTPIVSLQSVDPLYVSFSLPEQNVAELYPQQPVEVKVNLEKSAMIKGVITAIDSKVDQATRNIHVQAMIPNHNMQLYPGMFAKITIWLRNKKKVIAIPQTCISYSLHGDTVYVIKENGKDKDGKPILIAEKKYVKVGERRNDLIDVIEGIQPNEQVVTSGQLKLQDGSKVIINNSVPI